MLSNNDQERDKHDNVDFVDRSDLRGPKNGHNFSIRNAREKNIENCLLILSYNLLKCSSAGMRLTLFYQRREGLK